MNGLALGGELLYALRRKRQLDRGRVAPKEWLIGWRYRLFHRAFYGWAYLLTFVGGPVFALIYTGDLSPWPWIGFPDVLAHHGVLLALVVGIAYTVDYAFGLALACAGLAYLIQGYSLLLDLAPRLGAVVRGPNPPLDDDND